MNITLGTVRLIRPKSKNKNDSNYTKYTKYNQEIGTPGSHRPKMKNCIKNDSSMV